MAVYAYFNNATKMIRNWSINTFTIKPFCKELKNANDTWRLAYQFLVSDESEFQRNGNDFFLTTKDKSMFIKKIP